MLTTNGQTTCKSLICSVSHAAYKFKIMQFRFVYFRTVTLIQLIQPTSAAKVLTSITSAKIGSKKKKHPIAPAILRTYINICTSPSVKLCAHLYISMWKMELRQVTKENKAKSTWGWRVGVQEGLRKGYWATHAPV